MSLADSGRGSFRNGSRDRAVLRRARLWLGGFVAGLVLSGLSAFPLEWETARLDEWVGPQTPAGRALPALAAWVERVHVAVEDTGARHGFLAYATDWLAFAHLVIALAFVGPLRDPVRNVWVVEFGLMACVLVIPFALVCGGLRGIPWFWQLIDCSFGVLGAVPLAAARRAIRALPRTA